MADWCLALQCRRQLTHALAGPAQRGLGIPTAGRLHQPVQVLAQARMLDGALPAASRMVDAALRGPYGRLAQLPYAAANVPREAPVALATAAWPPRPAADASAASTSRRTRSSTTGAIAW